MSTRRVLWALLGSSMVLAGCRRRALAVADDAAVADALTVKPVLRPLLGNAVDVHTGKVLHRLSRLPVFELDETVLHDRALLVDASGLMEAVGVSTGARRWSHAVPGGCKSVVHQGALILCVGTESVVAVNADTGVVAWTHRAEAIQEGASVNGGIAIRVGSSTLALLDSVSGTLRVSREIPEWKGADLALATPFPDGPGVCVFGQSQDWGASAFLDRMACYDGELRSRWTKTLVLPKSEHALELRQLGPAQLVIGTKTRSDRYKSAPTADSRIVLWASGAEKKVAVDIAATIEGPTPAWLSPTDGHVSPTPSPLGMIAVGSYTAAQVLEHGTKLVILVRRDDWASHMLVADRGTGKTEWVSEELEPIWASRLEVIDDAIVVSGRTTDRTVARIFDLRSGAVRYFDRGAMLTTPRPSY
ncbi:MAG: PQQ-binding-like beta-propeller repeat protein [Myxococcales bacterium]|nr:PQQ-binding-like beta-propeller repeat protein [Myxococcales bacterium]